MFSRAAFVVVSCTASACSAAEIHVTGGANGSAYVESFTRQPTGVALGSMRLRPDVCAASQTPPGAYGPLEADDFVRFLSAEKLEVHVVRARADLVFADVKNAGTDAPVRFRIAVLDSPGAAGRELNEALLQHGEGSWGVHRSNLAVLAPNASLDDIVVLSVKTKLACWGVLTVAGHDDTYVVPGGYTEL